MNMHNKFLTPINQKFIEVFETFMDENQKTKIRANNVRQYTEGIIDLLLSPKIQEHLKTTEKYSDIHWKRKLEIIEKFYDKEIAQNFRYVFKVGGQGSHFNGAVSEEDLNNIISISSHIVEEIFVKYFLDPLHRFGSEDIFSIFSMLPLHNRIYILEKVYEHYQNPSLIDRLSLAYIKNGDESKAKAIISKAKKQNIINEEQADIFLYKIDILKEDMPLLYKLNADYKEKPEYSKAIRRGNLLVVGHPASKNVFDTAEAVTIFSSWFEKRKNIYPEFVNLFLCLMASDPREYI